MGIDARSFGEPLHDRVHDLRAALSAPGGPPVRDHVVTRAQPHACLLRLEIDREQLARDRLHDYLAALLAEADEPPLEIEIAAAQVSRRLPSRAEVAHCCEPEELVPLAAGGEHAGDVAARGGYDVKVLGPLARRAANRIHRVLLDGPRVTLLGEHLTKGMVVGFALVLIASILATGHRPDPVAEP